MINFLKPPKKEFYLAISEGNLGIEYFFDKDIKLLPYPIRRSIMTFLTMTIDELRTEEEKKEK